MDKDRLIDTFKTIISMDNGKYDMIINSGGGVSEWLSALTIFHSMIEYHADKDAKGPNVLLEAGYQPMHHCGGCMPWLEHILSEHEDGEDVPNLDEFNYFRKYHRVFRKKEIRTKGHYKSSKLRYH